MPNTNPNVIPTFDHKHYVPCLRWKQGEYQALLRLTDEVKAQITPLIEIAEIGWDFEEQADAKTVDDHLETLAKRLATKWGGRSAFVDLHLIAKQRMNDGSHPLKFVFDGFRSFGVHVVPVTSLERDEPYQGAVDEILQLDQRGLCVRLSLQDAAGANVLQRLNAMINRLRVQPGQVDFILDLGAPSFDPIEGFIKMSLAVISRLPNPSQWRTYTVCGTSFPRTMGEIERGVEVVPRKEWIFYRALLAGLSASSRKPTFGDYVIQHPDVLQVDMRLVKPAASVRYAIDDAWYIVKGSNVRDNGFLQYRGHCRTLIASGQYLGESFSAGDEHIRKCATGAAKPGNLSTWRWVGTNHHIHKVVFDIANFFGP